MITLLFCLMTVTPPAYVVDSLFTQVQEQFVYDFRKPSRYEVVLSPREARLIRSLGCEHGDCRDIATEILSDMGPSATRALFWGTKSTDAEIKNRCTRLLENLYWCRNCKGSGRCPYKDDDQHWMKCPQNCGGRPDFCVVCEGGGDYRYIYDKDVWFDESNPPALLPAPIWGLKQPPISPSK